MEKAGKYGALNIVAHPHPEGVYRDLFERAGKDPWGVRFHGDRFATLSPISSTRNDVFTGRLATWTEIDPKSNMIEKASLKESLLADSDVLLPDGIGFNSRVFSFAFREADHKMFIELKNDENQTISAGRAKLAVLKVLQAIRPNTLDELDVHLVTEANAVEKVLGIDRIRKVEILLDLPNPDDLSPEKQRILDRINDAKAKRVKTELVRAAGEKSLKIQGDFLEMAELAKDNGYVAAAGKNNDGDSVERSTKSFPLEIATVLQNDESRALATRRIAETKDID